MHILHAFAKKSKEYFLEMDKIGMRLKEERIRFGMNQAEFGALGGVKGLSQHHYEKGDRRPDSAYMANVAARGVDVQYVITGERSDQVLTPRERALLASFRTLDQRAQMVVAGVADGLMPETKVTNNIANSYAGGEGHGVNFSGVTFNEPVHLTVPTPRDKKSSE